MTRLISLTGRGSNPLSSLDLEIAETRYRIQAAKIKGNRKAMNDLRKHLSKLERKNKHA